MTLQLWQGFFQNQQTSQTRLCVPFAKDLSGKLPYRLTSNPISGFFGQMVSTSLAFY